MLCKIVCEAFQFLLACHRCHRHRLPGQPSPGCRHTRWRGPRPSWKGWTVCPARRGSEVATIFLFLFFLFCLVLFFWVPFATTKKGGTRKKGTLCSFSFFGVWGGGGRVPEPFPLKGYSTSGFVVSMDTTSKLINF